MTVSLCNANCVRNPYERKMSDYQHKTGEAYLRYLFAERLRHNAYPNKIMLHRVFQIVH